MKEKVKVVYVEKKESRFPDGVQWYVVGKDCDCMQEVLPVADNFGEDINLHELLKEYRGKQCEDCKKYFKLIVEKGNSQQKMDKVITGEWDGEPISRAKEPEEKLLEQIQNNEV